MTLNDVKADLFAFFGTHDTFSMNDNFDDLYILSENKGLDQGLLKKALKEYEEQKIVSAIEYDNVKTWVLEKPLQKYSQTIELTYPTLASLTKLINDYCAQTKNNEAKVNPLAVEEKDIQSLIVLVHQALGGNVPNV